MLERKDYKKPTYHRISVRLTDEEMEHLRVLQEFNRNRNLSSSASDVFIRLMEVAYEELQIARCVAEGKEVPIRY